MAPVGDDPEEYRDPFEQAYDLLFPPERQALPMEDDWRLWVPTMLPWLGGAPMADHHAVVWEWVFGLRRGVRPDPLIVCLARGGAKSSTAEGAVVAVGAKQTRRYVLYVSETQEQADDHVASIASLLEAPSLARQYPDLVERYLDKFGNVKGWRRNRLKCRNLFTVDAFGLDSRTRGAKQGDQRPDLIVFDDIDNESDSPDTTEKKIKTLTRRLFPTGSGDVAYLGLQNLVHQQSIFARLLGVASTEADFLTDATKIGPVPAIEGLEYVKDTDPKTHKVRYVITAGQPTWEGQNLATCQKQIADWGLSAFLSEAQHVMEVLPGGMYDDISWRRCKRVDVPDLDRICVWVDPAVSDTDRSDSMGIQCDGIDADTGTIYRLWSWERRASPLEAMKLAVEKALIYGADTVGVETDQGGDTWEIVYNAACRAVAEDREQDFNKIAWPAYAYEKGGSYGSKVHRQQQQLAEYQGGRFVHVEGTHGVLEAALRRFPRTKPLDLADAAHWSSRDLIENTGGAPGAAILLFKSR